MKDLFCGSADGYPAADFKPKSIPWDSGQLIGHLDKNQFKLTEDVISSNKATFWDNLCSEYDAENFCLYLKDEGFELSPEFKAFEHVWRRDEYNHYWGFRYMYCILYNVTIDEVQAKLSYRCVNFTPIRDLLEDEFKICLLLAYDEIATTKSYADDYNFYRTFGHSNFLKWIKLVTRDEAYHFHNCMELIGKNYYHRVPEIPDLVDRFIGWDKQRNLYEGTFVLDHEYYSEDFLISCGDIMKRYFR